jgi:hypothetical protein
MLQTARYSSLLALAFLGACVTVPNGPSTLVLPGEGKSFDQFRADDYECRQFASSQLGGATAASAASQSGVATAAVGTLLGAAAGAAINGGHGAGVGAGTGLVVGGLAGAGAAQTSGYGMQQRYDFAYQQCMYAKGHRVPVAGRFSAPSVSRRAYPPSGTPYPPPPGAGYYPPPPPPR